MTLGNSAREKLFWRMENLKLCNERKIQQGKPHMIIQTDASTKDLQESFDKEEWSKEEKHFHINVLKLLALKSATLSFTKNLSDLTIHVQVDNKDALAYFLKMGATRNLQLLKISLSVWNYLLSHSIKVTEECLSRRLTGSPGMQHPHPIGSFIRKFFWK